MKKFVCRVADRKYIVSAKDAADASRKAKIADLKTKQGYKVVYLSTGPLGKDIAIIEREGRSWGTDYIVAFGYNTNTGEWAQGHYDFRSLQEALDWARKEYRIENWKKL